MTLAELQSMGAKPVAPSNLTREQLLALGGKSAGDSPTTSSKTEASAPGIAETFSRGVSSYVPFGKQAEAAFQSLPVVGTGKPYSENLKAINARTKAGEEANPMAADLGKGTGLGASMLVPGGVPAQAALGALRLALSDQRGDA